MAGATETGYIVTPVSPDHGDWVDQAVLDPVLRAQQPLPPKPDGQGTGHVSRALRPLGSPHTGSDGLRIGSSLSSQ
jgi:hypothetical protein